MSRVIGFNRRTRSLAASSDISIVEEGAFDDHEHQYGSAFEQPTFLGTWSNYGSPFQEARFSKFANLVIVEGVVKSTGADIDILTVPLEFRPDINLLPFTFVFDSDTNTILRLDLTTLFTLKLTVLVGHISVGLLSLYGVRYTI